VAPNAADNSNAARADDLTRIEGIGSKTARLLNRAGISTFEDLASRSAPEIAGIPDISRIPSAHPAAWIRQAQGLAAAKSAASGEAAPTDAPGLTPPEPTDTQHYEPFAVTMLFNEDGSIRDTRMEHLRTGDVRRWAGWAPEAMLDFVMTATSAAVPHRAYGAGPEAEAEAEAEPVTSSASEPDSSPSSTRSMHPALSAGFSVEHSVVHAGQPFSVTINLDLADAAVTADSLAYDAVIVARPLGAASRQALGRVQGSLAASATSAITVEAVELPPGAYRLVGAVSIRELGTGQPRGLAAPVEGMVLQVLAG
jgi:Helix-hairpin-helix domain